MSLSENEMHAYLKRDSWIELKYTVSIQIEAVQGDSILLSGVDLVDGTVSSISSLLAALR